jgi:putative ABC transport system ATP-binding protein
MSTHSQEAASFGGRVLHIRDGEILGTRTPATA